jgi:hypothetical protein
MNDRIKKLAEQARLLTPDERADLIDELLTMAPEPMPGWDKTWSEEAARRWQAFAASGTDAYHHGGVGPSRRRHRFGSHRRADWKPKSDHARYRGHDG